MDSHCDPQGSARNKFSFRNPLVLTLCGTTLLLGASFFLEVLRPFRHAFFDYLGIVWWAIALGFLLGGAIDYYVPKEYISKYLARSQKRTVLYSVGFGLLASACSHGVLALAMELHKKGASGPAVVSFLLASPWANLPATLLLISFFGLKGLLIIVAALVIAVNTGLIFQMLDRRQLIERNANSVLVDHAFSIREDIARRCRDYHFNFETFVRDSKGIAKGAYELVQMVLFWVLVGIVLASLASVFVPDHVFERFLGPSFLGLLITMAVATVLEVCSEGTAPLAFELYRQTGAFGNAFAFLMGGVVTDYTEIGLLWSNLGKKTALWMVAITIPQVMVLGWWFNLIP